MDLPSCAVGLQLPGPGEQLRVLGSVANRPWWVFTASGDQSTAGQLFGSKRHYFGHTEMPGCVSGCQQNGTGHVGTAGRACSRCRWHPHAGQPAAASGCTLTLNTHTGDQDLREGNGQPPVVSSGHRPGFF